MNRSNLNCNETVKIALAQLAPVWLNREETLKKVCRSVKEAASNTADLIVFGEAFVPGYPFWIELTEGARFNDGRQKKIHAEYLRQAVQIERGDLSDVCLTAKENSIAIYLGIIERPIDRAGLSLYCSLVYIDKTGEIKSVHRKLMPTYEERLSWSIGDGNGLVTHSLEIFTIGGLNCWENWMPLARASLYAQGENLHVAVWPGSYHNTYDITPVIAKEGRSFVISVGAIMRKSDAMSHALDIPEISEHANEWIANGGSCAATPCGDWLLEPQIEVEEIYYVDADFEKVLEERQNFDPSGHYSRPDVTKLSVDRTRQSVVNFTEADVIIKK